MSEIQNDKTWYYAKPTGEKFGPYSEGEIIKLIQNGLLNADDYIWMVDLDNWVTVGNSIYSFYMPQNQ